VIGGGAPALARRLNWLYLDMTNRRTAANACSPVPVGSAPIPQDRHSVWRSEYALLAGLRMAQPMSTSHQMPGTLRPAQKAARAIVTAAAGLGVVLGLAAVVLWFHYGTAVFFETIVSGLSACF
jgi:hypothetical protein